MNDRTTMTGLQHQVLGMPVLGQQNGKPLCTSQTKAENLPMILPKFSGFNELKPLVRMLRNI